MCRRWRGDHLARSGLSSATWVQACSCQADRFADRESRAGRPSGSRRQTPRPSIAQPIGLADDPSRRAEFSNAQARGLSTRNRSACARVLDRCAGVAEFRRAACRRSAASIAPSSRPVADARSSRKPAGPVQVRLRIDGSSESAAFTSTHAAATRRLVRCRWSSWRSSTSRSLSPRLGPGPLPGFYICTYVTSVS